MELDELLQREGLEADGAEENLAWARARALQLVGDVAQDPELGPLLEGTSLPDGGVPAPPPPPPSAALDPATSVDDSEVAEHGMHAAPAEAPSDAVEPAAAPEAEAEPEPDPLADMDFDGLPGLDEPEAPVEASPAPSEPVAEQGVPDAVEATTTEPSDLPPIPSAAAPAQDDSDEDIEEIDEIELLDDDDLELVEDDEDEEPAAEAGAEALPEWKAALTSAQLGGDAKADEDSGLLRPPMPEAPPEASDESLDDDEG